MKICPIASSSSANMYFISHEDQVIIIDAGVNGTAIAKEFLSLCDDFSNLKGVFITHLHRDHCVGVKVFSNKIKAAMKTQPSLVPCTLYGGANTELHFGEFVPPLAFPVEKINKAVEVGPFRVEAISVPHDTPNLSYRITCGEESVGICTDLGYIADEVLDFFEGVQMMVLESNYDPDLLRKNTIYPAHKIQRVFGDEGHLSNEDASWAACELFEEGTKTILFAHLSTTNNTPDLARAALEKEMSDRDKTYPCKVAIAPVKDPQCWYQVSTGEELSL